jgi:acyl dehydratase
VNESESRFAQYVGRASAPLVVEVERGQIRRFAEAVGDDNPIYFEDGARVPAPPTFAITLRPNDPRAGIEIDWKKLLHGEQEIEYARPIHAGDRLTLCSRIADAGVKQTKSGIMDVMVLETVATDESGARVYATRSTLLVRR